MPDTIDLTQSPPDTIDLTNDDSPRSEQRQAGAMRACNEANDVRKATNDERIMLRIMELQKQVLVNQVAFIPGRGGRDCWTKAQAQAGFLRDCMTVVNGSKREVEEYLDSMPEEKKRKLCDSV